MKKKILIFLLTVVITFEISAKTDDRGFNTKTKINKETKTFFDVEGYDIEGYDKNGFTKEGINKETKDFFDKAGYDKLGYNTKKFTRNGIHKNGTFYDDNGYDKDGYNKDGYTIDGWNKDKSDLINLYTKSPYSKEGLNKDKRYQNGLLYDYKTYNMETFDNFKNTIFVKNTRNNSYSFNSLINIYLQHCNDIDVITQDIKNDLRWGDYEKANENKLKSNKKELEVLNDQINILNEVAKKMVYFDFYVYKNLDIKNNEGINCELNLLNSKIIFPTYIYFVNEKGTRYKENIATLTKSDKIINRNDYNFNIYSNINQFNISDLDSFVKLFESNQIDVLIGTNEGEIKLSLNNIEIEKLKEAIYFYKSKKNN